MSRVGGITVGTAAARRPSRAGGGFAMPGHAGTQDAPSASAAGAVPALLALQEAPRNPGRDAEGQARRGEAALDELRGLQLDLLRGRDDAGRLQRLAALAEDAGAVANPSLRELLAGVSLRARVELARRRVASASVG